MLSEDGSITNFIIKIKKFPSVTRKKMSIRKQFQEENNIFKIDEEDFRRIRSHVMNEVEEEKEEKYKQLEFEFDEDLVAPI